MVAQYLTDSQGYTGLATSLLEGVAAMRRIDTSLARLGWGTCLATVELHNGRKISDQLDDGFAAGSDPAGGLVGEIALFLAQQDGRGDT
jgi:hypothetical protein